MPRGDSTACGENPGEGCRGEGWEKIKPQPPGVTQPAASVSDPPRTKPADRPPGWGRRGLAHGRGRE